MLKDPDDPNILKAFALFLATCRQEELRDDRLAIQLAKRACELTKRQNPTPIMALAEIHAQAGRSELAVAATREAIDLAEAAGDIELAEALRGRLERYRNQISAEPAR